ncbi:MAG: O-methyltransferase [Clostridia bacterium]|nr:O-methyltransferase [Clostridia bacterium]
MINFNNEELEKVKKDALERHIPIIMDDSLEKIVELIKEEKPKRILEIGTAVGYSASCFALSYKDTIVDTIELDEERYNEAKENIKKIGVETRVNLMLGNAVEILPTINNTYDMIFIDANKGKYPIFLEEGIRLSNNNALIIADNILYKGYVLSDYNLHKQRTAVRHLREYIKESETNEHLKTEILEIGDGLAISRVTK